MGLVLIGCLYFRVAKSYRNSRDSTMPFGEKGQDWFSLAEWVTGLVLMKIWSWEKPLVPIDRITCSWGLFPKEMP